MKLEDLFEVKVVKASDEEIKQRKEEAQYQIVSSDGKVAYSTHYTMKDADAAAKKLRAKGKKVKVVDY